MRRLRSDAGDERLMAEIIRLCAEAEKRNLIQRREEDPEWGESMFTVYGWWVRDVRRANKVRAKRMEWIPEPEEDFDRGPLDFKEEDGYDPFFDEQL